MIQRGTIGSSMQAHVEVMTLGIKSRTDIRMIDDQCCIISQDLDIHNMANMHGNADKMVTFPSRIGGDIQTM